MSIQLVIDPGHGGDNHGAEYHDYMEKDITIQVGLAMAEELEKYDNIDVYLTRESDKEIGLAKRCEFAKDNNADFYISLHFNASEAHTLYGMETWVSAFGECYAKGASFAKVWLNEMSDTTLHNRGVKTRLNEDGIDYYGVIKRCTEYNIPSCIIEHCYMDIEEEYVFYDTSEALVQLGKCDATAVAKYFGLQSAELGVDYSNYAVDEVPVPSVVMAPDETEPTVSELIELSRDDSVPEMEILLRGEDQESGLLYYDYSLDGGNTYTKLLRWPKGETEIKAAIPLQYDKDMTLVCRVYNGYDLYTESNFIKIDAISQKAENDAATDAVDVFSESESTMEEVIQVQDFSGIKADTGGLDFFIFMIFAILFLSIIIVLVTLKLVFPSKKKRKKSRKKYHK